MSHFNDLLLAVALDDCNCFISSSVKSGTDHILTKPSESPLNRYFCVLPPRVV